MDEGVGANFLTRGVASGVFQNNQIALQLATSSGPGNFFLYFTDSFGDPVVYFNIGDGLGGDDQRLFSPSNRVHFNWAFTAPGLYEVDVEAPAFFGPGQTNPTASGIATYHFGVQTVPEPGTALLLTLGSIAFIQRRRATFPKN